jgi:CTP:molybdopterin cytidylyltransferase MocA
VGLLLAAGAGRRMGRPKALLRDAADVSFLDRSLRVLIEGGCSVVTVVLGAAAEQACELLAASGWGPGRVRVVVAADWDEGMGASLRAGLRALAADTDGEAALVTLVDLPDVDAAVLRRVVAAAADAPAAAAGPGTGQGPGPGPATGAAGAALVRATYGGRPGHPVLIGRDHWDGVVASARGDHGARDYLASHPHVSCECGDLAGGLDVDRPEDLRPDHRGWGGGRRRRGRG